MADEIRAGGLSEEMGEQKTMNHSHPGTKSDYEKIIEEVPILQKVKDTEEVIWLNPDRIPFSKCKGDLELSMEDIDDADARLRRFAPLIARLFPETQTDGGIIESDLTGIPAMQDLMDQKVDGPLPGRLLLKRDDQLPVAGSVKARGGIYEVLKHAEDLALEYHLLHLDDDYTRLADPDARAFFESYTIQVGSTGNLGISIGMMGAALGFHVVVRMSADAMCDPANYPEPQSDNYFTLIFSPYNATGTLKSAVPAN